MNIDKQTLADLEIFKTGENSVSVFSLIDKTKTTGGNLCLHQKFLYPPGDIGSLKKQQETISYLARNKDTIRLPFSNNKLKSLEDYLSSNIDLIKSNSLIECTWFYLADKQAYWYLKEWISTVVEFVAGFNLLITPVHEELPEILKAAFNEINGLSCDPEFKKIMATSAQGKMQFYKVLQADRVIRTKFRTSLKRIIEWYYEIDALTSMAFSTMQHNFQFPEITNEEDCSFHVEGLYHPLLQHPVSCDASVSSDSSFIFLTGPNMAGKTTLLKAAGIAVYLGHLGMGIPVVKGKMRYFDRLISSLNITDSIQNGYSFFYNEVRRVKELAESLSKGEKVFSLLDELFRGTNVKDAYDASVLIMKGLIPWQDSVFIVATHLWEIWKQIETFPNVRSFCFESEIQNGFPVFTFRMMPGVSNMRLGLKIIENEQIMALLIRKENRLVKQSGSMD
jgi:DNA mismatch repair protein MutS